MNAGIKESSGEALRLFEDADANASARIILLPVETVADILIIEDDPSINEVVCAHLERRGYRCRQAFSGTEGLMLLREQRPDVVITDLMLPGVPGEEIVRAIRGADSALPIIVISARITAADKISLLQAGADDYLTKPFDLDELQARIEVQRRHHAERAHAGTAASAAKADGSSQLLAFRRWELDPDGRVFCVDGEEVALTRTEFNILELLMGTTAEGVHQAGAVRAGLGRALLGGGLHGERARVEPAPQAEAHGHRRLPANRVGHGLQTAQCLIGAAPQRAAPHIARNIPDAFAHECC